MVTGSVDDRGESTLPLTLPTPPPPPATSPPLFPLPSRTSSHVCKGDATKIKLKCFVSGTAFPTTPHPPIPPFSTLLLCYAGPFFVSYVSHQGWSCNAWGLVAMLNFKREHCVTVYPSLTNMARTCGRFAFMLFCFCNSMAENILLTPLFGSSHYLLFRHIGEELGNRGHKVRVFCCSYSPVLLVPEYQHEADS